MELPIEPRKLIYIVCPMCGLNRILEKTGAMAKRISARGGKLRKPLGSKEPGRIRFDTVNLESAIILQIRDPRGGRGGGLKVVDGLRLEELKDKEEYSDLLEQLRAQCESILEVLKRGQ